MTESVTVPVKNGHAPITRRTEPLGLFDDFATEFERFWSRPLAFFPWARPLRGFTHEPIAFAPRMDVYEQGDFVYVKAELPGLKKEDVVVEVEGDDLTLRGETRAEKEVKQEDYYRSERTFGSFYRRMHLPPGITAEQIEANLKDGVLEVRIPKPAAPKPQTTKVPVN